MAAPLAPWLARWIAVKAGTKAAQKWGARTHGRRMAAQAAEMSRRTYRYSGKGRKFTPFGPAPQGPYAQNPYKSRGRSSSSSSQQNGGRWRSYQPTIPSAQSGKLGTKWGKAKRGFRAGGKARASRQPYCPVHKQRHWCWFTSKHK